MKKYGFTLIELLVVIAIIAVLATLGIVVAGRAAQTGQLAREVSAGRNLMAAYLAYAADNNGELMPGYTADPGTVRDDRGGEVHYPASGRYPWRLANFLKTSPRGTLIVNQQAKLTENKAHNYYVYVVSLLPTLGMNTVFVGGNETGALAPTPGNFGRLGAFCLTRLSQAVRASQQIVFCSAHFQSDPGDGQYGFHMVEPPYTNTRKWSGQYDESAPPSQHGYVHLRYGGKAVAAMLDGHVELLDYEQLQDMRRWCNLAAEEDKPSYVLTRQN